VSGERGTQALRLVQRLPAAVALLVLLLGAGVLAGWMAGSDVFQFVRLGLPAMVPTTATCLVLAAVALGCMKAAGRWRWLGWSAAACALVTGALALASFATDAAVPAPTFGHSRMSPQSASTFILLGGALLCAGRQGRWEVLAMGLALGALLLPLTALTGYLFQERRLYEVRAGTGMAPHTALAQLLLGLGGLALYPHRGLMGAFTAPTAGGVMARRMLPAVLLPWVVGAVMRGTTQGALLSPQVAPPLFIVVMVVALAAIIWRNSLTLNALQAEQVKAEQQARAEAERQRALAQDNARLYQAAQQSAREREEVLAIVSHDLKNPLSTIRVSTGLLSAKLRGQPDTAGMLRQVGAIDRAVASMLSLIHQLLDAARLDAGQALAITRRPEPVDTLVAEALAGIEPLAAQKSLRLEQHLGAARVVPCDRQRILQVLANLLSNAVKFTPDGGLLRVETRTTDGEVHVSVKDTGPGIPESERAQLFQRHWQAERTARLGSGLGLYIAHGIVHAHGGRIWVDSPPGAGSTFTFALPVDTGPSRHA
jgi:signal transduction histidine kinase